SDRSHHRLARRGPSASEQRRQPPEHRLGWRRSSRVSCRPPDFPAPLLLSDARGVVLPHARATFRRRHTPVAQTPPAARVAAPARRRKWFWLARISSRENDTKSPRAAAIKS